MPIKTLQIRNSTAEFLIFTKQSGGDNIDVRIQDGISVVEDFLVVQMEELNEKF